MRTSIAILAAVLIGAGCGESPDTDMASTEEYFVYIGTSGRQSDGIHAARFEPATGTLTPLGLVAEADAPGFLEIHPDGKRLYAIGRTPRDAAEPWQGVAAYEIDHTTGKLTFLNRVDGKGEGPCHVTVDSQGRTVAVANYSGGSIASMKVTNAGISEAVSSFVHTGSSVHPKRQTKPYAHSVNFSPDDRFLIAADLGADKLFIYEHDPATGALTEHGSAQVAPGGGPRHFTFHPNGRYAYVINELGNTVTAFSWDAAAGSLSEIQTIGTLPDDFTGSNTTAEVLVHPSGKFLYGSNRGHNSIAVFSVDEATGKLTFVEHATEGINVPRNFRIDPTGKYLFVGNQRGDDIKVFAIDQTTGGLTATGDVLSAPGPICIRFVKVQ